MFGYLKRGESLIFWLFLLFGALSVEGALSPFLGFLTPDLAVVVIIASMCCLEEVKGLLFAFLGGILLDLRWQSIVGLSSFYLVCASYILSFFPKKARFKFGFKMVLLGIGALVFFQLFKFGVYRLLGIEYDVSFIVLIGRVLLDALIFCFVLVLMRVGGLRKLEV